MTDRPTPETDTEPTAPLGAPSGGATVAEVPPEVTRFVSKVRQQLSDLEPETQDELLDGLVADLSDRVAEDGPGALGDPTAYAGELRAAAGLSPRSRVRVPNLRGRGASARGLGARLDAAHAAWDRQLARQDVVSADLLQTLRPVWWVLRAWIAVQAADAVFGGYPMSVVPYIGGPYVGGMILLVAALASVQMGRGLVWPGTSRAAAARVVLLVGNLAAIVLLPAVLGWMRNSYAASDYVDSGVSAAPMSGLTNDGNTVYNIFPYDAQGRPLTGVQLFDQSGHRLSAVDGTDEYGTGQARYDGGDLSILTFPWRNGFEDLWNVYPRPEQHVDYPGGSIRDPEVPALPRLPKAQVPPATLPSSAPSATPSPSASTGASPSASPAASGSPSASPTS